MKMMLVIYQQGPTFNLINPSFVLTNTSNTEDSTYTINLIVGDSDGCSHDTSITVVIHPLPNVLFDFEDKCDGELIEFISQSDGANVSLQTWLWDFDDLENEDSGDTVTYTFTPMVNILFVTR